MSKVNQNNVLVEFDDVKDRQKKSSSSPKNFNSNKIWHSLKENFWFAAYIAGLVFTYISSNYVLDKNIHYKLRLKDQVKDFKIEATTSAAELMMLSSRTMVKQEVIRRGLKLEEAIAPPTVLKMTERKKKQCY
ncbi:MAG: FtsL-like putative cell division protein [Bacteroidales bacterium]